MIRLKTLSLLAGMVAVLAVSATPASAWWQSASQSGTGKVLASGSFKYGNPSQGTVTCPKEEVKGIWSIQTKGQIKEQRVNGKQELTTFGPHLNIQVKSWGAGCTATVGSTIFKAGEVEVKPCELQLVQQKESFTATGGVVTPCLVKIGIGVANLCEVQVPAGMEKQAGSNEGQNVGLLETKLSEVGANQLDKVNTKGILAYSVGKNSLCTLTHSTNTAELVGLEFEAEGVKAV